MTTADPARSAADTLPPSLAANPRLSTWLDLSDTGHVLVRVGKVELGQGIWTALTQAAAEELGVDDSRVVVQPVSTAAGPAEGLTAGSLSVARSVAALRQVCAEVRALLIEVAAARLDADPAALVVRDGVVGTAAGDSAVSYWDLDADVLDRDARGPSWVRPAPAPADPPNPPRVDLPDKVLGRPRFLHDLHLPGQVWGRVVRPPVRAAHLSTVDTSLVGAHVIATVRQGDFLGVVAEREEVAIRAAAALADTAQWELPPNPAGTGDPAQPRRSAPADRIDVVNICDATAAVGVVTTVRATYTRPFLAHAAIGPSCAIARWAGSQLTVWSHSQGVYPLRAALAVVFGVPEQDVVVHHVEAAGSYGHNGADDAAFDAALLARAVPGRPVQVVWSRADELGSGPLGPAMAVDVEAGLDARGHVATWSVDVWSQGHVARPGYGGSHGLLGAAHRDRQVLPPSVDPPLAAGGGSVRNADPGYDFPARRVTGHRVVDTRVRTSSLRALGAFTNVFAIESLMDELSRRIGADPLEYRLAHLSDPRARAVLERAAELAGWRREQGGRDQAAADAGRGIAWARYKGTSGYCAVVADVEAVHEIRVTRLVIAADVGRIVSLDGVVNQLEGGAIQAASWTLLEQARLDGHRVTSTDWETYPILRFRAVPDVHVEVINRPDEPSVGAGEIAHGPTAAAIANAVRDALGVDVRDLPLTPERIVAALET
ncbi:xanthine dehydrogenase family protein molybdopterin-binding subunit [Phytoactinopolyspora limicola]|uniref:xanthine dehydrogenase family protein molybdopterin-binding subunit n=1 Tax=Phytoactinopolyspora limicola TaxID=2715536 RepID=UPI00140CB8C5|nr:molybdopterin cofactor-binding domain-containing protein [Phytoactinopolyspora limicola]